MESLSLRELIFEQARLPVRFVIPIYTCIFAPRSRVVVYSNVLRRRGRQGLL